MHAFDSDIVYNYIIHGASNADPIKFARYPVETLNTNLLGGIHIWSYAQNLTECRFVILSFFEEYGNAGKSEYKERDIGVLDFIWSGPVTWRANVPSKH